MAPDAPDFVVQAAYRACIKKFHPDHYSGADARQKTADILEAYRLIGSAEARAEFDRSRYGARADRESREAPTANDRKKSADGNEPPPAKQLVVRHKLSLHWLLLAGAALAIYASFQSLSGSFGTSKSNGQDATSGWGPVVEVTSAPPSPMPSQSKIANLDEVLQFTNPSACEMTSATDNLFKNLIIFDPPEYIGRRGPAVRVKGFEKPLLPSFSRTVGTNEGGYPRDNEATLAIAGNWHGLKVSKIRIRAMESSSFWERQIRFLEPASRVREKLNELGFQLPAIGQFREISEQNVVSVGIGIEEVPGGSALYCGSSIYY